MIFVAALFVIAKREIKTKPQVSINRRWDKRIVAYLYSGQIKWMDY